MRRGGKKLDESNRVGRVPTKFSEGTRVPKYKVVMRTSRVLIGGLIGGIPPSRGRRTAEWSRAIGDSADLGGEPV